MVYNLVKNMIKKLKKINTKALFLDTSYGLACAIFFSAFIYLENFGITIKALNSIFGLLAFAMLLYIPKRAILVAGFFIGLFWFYWIGYSFKYNGVGYLEPFITIAFAFIYMLFFTPLALTKKVYIRAIFLVALSYFEPMDFNWLVMELPFVDSFFGIQKYQFIVILLSLSLIAYIKNPKLKPLALLMLAFALNYSNPKQEDAPLSIKLVQTDIPQDEKWRDKNLNKTIFLVLEEIEKATIQNYDVILFPEASIPLYLNKQDILIKKLKELSYGISIVVGSLYKDETNHYNVTYAFENGNFSVAKKMVLVPFGEYIPLPSFLKESVNNYFFAGASDFKTASIPTDFILKGVKFRNAICYEATRDELYQGSPSFMLASSNNAWFAPSIEPTLQKLLMRYFARKYNTTIYHSANYMGSGVIK